MMTARPKEKKDDKEYNHFFGQKFEEYFPLLAAEIEGTHLKFMAYNKDTLKISVEDLNKPLAENDHTVIIILDFLASKYASGFSFYERMLSYFGRRFQQQYVGGHCLNNMPLDLYKAEAAYLSARQRFKEKIAALVLLIDGKEESDKVLNLT